jgi:hypothetical protein
VTVPEAPEAPPVADLKAEAPEAPEAPPVAELEAEAPEAPEAPPVAVRPMGHGVPVMGEGGVTWRA